MTCINVKICVKNQDISLFQSYTSVYVYVYICIICIYIIYIYNGVCVERMYSLLITKLLVLIYRTKMEKGWRGG